MSTYGICQISNILPTFRKIFNEHFGESFRETFRQAKFHEFDITRDTTENKTVSSASCA